MDFDNIEDLKLADKLSGWTKGRLTEQQFELAKKIQEKAKANGLNPDFVLPMVMQESGFNSKAVSPVGAIGVMQIMPSTAEMYKCDNPNDVDQNIDCGMNILKDLISKPNIGNNSYKVLAGYNAGPNSQFFQTGNLDDAPLETLKHMDAISTYYGGDLPNADIGAEQQGTSKVDMGAGKKVTDRPAPPPVAPSAWLGAAIGAPIGASVATTAALVPQAKNLYEHLIDKLTTTAPNAPAIDPTLDETLRNPTVLTPIEEVEGTPSRDGAWGRKTGYGIGSGSTQEQSSKYQRAVPRGKVTGPNAKLFGIAKPGEATQLTQRWIDQANAAEQKQVLDEVARMRVAQRRIEAARLAQSQVAEEAMLARDAATAAAAAPKTLGRYGNYLDKAVQALGVPLRGLLGGASAGYSALDAFNRANAKDYSGATIAGVGGLAGLGSMAVGSMGALPAIATAAPLYNSVSDRIEYLKAHPEEQVEPEVVNGLRFGPMGEPYRD